MLPPHLNPTTILIATTLTLTLTASFPTSDANQTTITSILAPDRAAPLKADTCPTPPTEFLPYAPPSGYAPAAGCPPASEGTQPSEDDPPAGFYGGSSSGGGGGGTASSAEASGAAGGRGEGVGWRGLLWFGIVVGVGSAVGWIA